MELTSRKAMEAQYGTDGNLAARQSIYRFRRERDRVLYDEVLTLAGIGGDETVLDVGCGNGMYLKALSLRGHRGPVLGIDLSAGMAAAASAYGPAACGDAQRLPVRSASADVALCPHMLYHVPDQAAAVAELRRVVRPSGRAVVTTNALDHLRELDELAAAVTGAPLVRELISFRMDDGDEVLRTSFDTVERHDLRGVLDVTDPAAVVSYVRSMPEVYGGDQEQLEEIGSRVGAVIARAGAFEITTAVGAFVCA